MDTTFFLRLKFTPLSCYFGAMVAALCIDAAQPSERKKCIEKKIVRLCAGALTDRSQNAMCEICMQEIAKVDLRFSNNATRD